MTDRDFASLQAAFERARTAHPDGFSQSSFTIAGQAVDLRVVGHELAGHVVAPLRHLANLDAAPPGPRLEIYLWDAEESRVPPPPGSRSESPGSGVVTSSPDGRFLAYERPYGVVALDRSEQHLVGCVESASRLPLVERARPLNVPLTVWCADRDVQLVHAGLVAKDGRGVLLPGLAEAGKSTAALACACGGFDFLADDCVALRLSPQGEFEGHSLYRSTTLEPAHLAGFPPPLPGAGDGTESSDEKSLVLLGEAPPLRVTRVAAIRVLALPHIVDGAGSQPRPATKREALLRLAPGSLLKAVSPRACLRVMARLVDRVPSYWLELDRDLAQIPRRVEGLLAEAGRG